MDNVERARVELKMPVGELNIQGGARGLMDADFTYNVAAWKPEIQYRSDGKAGDLVLEQHGPASSHGDNRWDLRFNDSIPIDLRIDFGAGEARLNLGNLSLRSVDLEIGAGELNMDLRGSPRNDYSVRIRGGVGEATVHLPTQIGVSATVAGGLGDISVSGLKKDGDRYVNDAYARSALKIHLDVQGGVGAVKLISD